MHIDVHYSPMLAKHSGMSHHTLQKEKKLKDRGLRDGHLKQTLSQKGMRRDEMQFWKPSG